MKILKHLFTALLLMCATMATAHDFEVDGIYYNIADATNKTVAVTCQGDTSSSYSNEYTGDVVIPESVTYNGTTYSVTNIGASAFYDCTGLTSIEIPNSVTSIASYAFSYCTGLTSIEIPNSVTSIGYTAFRDCLALTSIEIPNSVTFIGNDAFWGCSGLASIEIPCSVTSIGSNAFYNTAWYNNQPDGVVYAGNILYKYKGTMPANTSIVIKEGTTAIGVYAFEYCSGLTSIVIPSSVSSIGERAFYGCSGLASIVIPNSVTSIGYEVFEGTAWYDNQPEGVVYAGSVLYKYKGTMPANTSIVIKEGTTAIGVYAFEYCSGLTSIVIPSSVTSIEKRAFYDCSGLTSIEIPNSVTSIGEEAFYGCSGLTSIVIGNGVTSIGEWAFYRCTGLTSIVIGNSVTSIGSYAFRYCDGLTSVEIPNSVTSIGSSAFRDCTGLTSITIPNSVTSIGGGAFYSCTGLASIVIGNSVTSIGGSAFGYCYGLTSITSLIRADALFTVYSSTFSNLDKNACTLYVPYGAKETYASTGGWNEFANIVELERSTFNATFYIDGELIAVYDIKEGDTIVYPDVDEREGYTLVWTTDVDVMPSENIVIEGTFIANAYTVTYTVDGEVYATDSIAYGSEIVLRDEPTKGGRKFSGWSEIPSTMPAQDVVVEGKFCYTVVFMADGKYYSSSALYYGDEIIAPSGIPQKEGYAFVEWGELPGAMPARDMTIHAIFSVKNEKYQLMFIIDGEVYQTLFVGYGSEIEYPQKDGYIITWETENLPQTMPAENLFIIGTSALDTVVECVKDDNEKIVYTLDGHRILDVENLEEGIYIIDGKKVFVK